MIRTLMEFHVVRYLMVISLTAAVCLVAKAQDATFSGAVLKVKLPPFSVVVLELR